MAKKKKVVRKATESFTITFHHVAGIALVIAVAVFIAYNLGATAAVQKINNMMQNETYTK